MLTDPEVAKDKQCPFALCPPDYENTFYFCLVEKCMAWEPHLNNAKGCAGHCRLIYPSSRVAQR